MFTNYKDIVSFLTHNSDQKCSVFNKKLIDTKYSILGIKLPALRTIAKDIAKHDAEMVLHNFTFNYYEEILLHGFVLAYCTMPEQDRVSNIDKYITYFDNWSVVDSFCSSLKSVNKHKELYLDKINEYLSHSSDFVVRFGLVLLMDYYLTADYITITLSHTLISDRNSYYIQMALAWLYATALAKNYTITLDFLSNNKDKLSTFVRRKTISKCNDSFRIPKHNKIEIKNILG